MIQQPVSHTGRFLHISLYLLVFFFFTSSVILCVNVDSGAFYNIKVSSKVSKDLYNLYTSIRLSMSGIKLHLWCQNTHNIIDTKYGIWVNLVQQDDTEIW